MGAQTCIADVLRPVLPETADEIVAVIRAELPAYDDAFAGPYEQVIRDGVERGLRRFADVLSDPGRADAVDRQVNVGLGRGEFRQGRGLDVLLAAYRIGARIAWRRFVAAGVEAGVPATELYSLGESVFAYIDGLSAEAAEGYAAEQSMQAGETQRLRRALIRALVREPIDEDEVRAAADAAGWALPNRMAALVSEEASERLAGRIGADVVAARLDGQTVAFVPDVHAPGRLAQVALALGRAPRRARARARLGAGIAVARAGASRARGRPGVVRAGGGAPGRPAAGRGPQARRRARRPGARAARRGAGVARGRSSPRRWRRGSTTRAGWRRSPRRWTSTRRPCATGWGSCASASTASRIPDRRFELAVALRARRAV